MKFFTLCSLICILAIIQASEVRNLVRRLLQDYEKDDPPSMTKPTEVQMGFYIFDMRFTDEGNMKAFFYFRQQWSDARLEYKPIKGSLGKIHLKESYHRLWTPDLFFRNSIYSSQRKNALGPEVLTFLHENGKIWHVMTVDGEFRCGRRLDDSNTFTCGIITEVYGYTMDTVVMRWLPQAVELGDELAPPYSLINYTLEDCSQNYTTGAYPCLEVEFIFELDSDHDGTSD